MRYVDHIGSGFNKDSNIMGLTVFPGFFYPSAYFDNEVVKSIGELLFAGEEPELTWISILSQ